MTYQGQPVGSSAQVLRALIIIMIALVSYWAANGGLDQIPIADNSAVSTSQSE